MRALKAVRPPIAIEREYHKRLKKLLKEMDKSLFWWLRAELRKNGVSDGVAVSMADKLKKLQAYWQKRYEEEAWKTAEWFANSTQKYITTNLQGQMKRTGLNKLGFDLKYTYHSRAERNTFQSIVRQNVNLITSIASEHLTNVNGVIFRGIETGHDLSRISEDLEKTFGVSERRAQMIARDQTNKATNNLSRDRLVAYGISKGKWLHTSSGKTYRDSHVEMDGEIYDLEQGCYDDDYGAYVQPGELVNCHCCCVPVIDLGNGEADEK